MPWSNTPGGGFTSAGVTPWLPMGDPAACNVADQDSDLDSVLAFTRRAIAARTTSDDLAVGPYRSLPSPPGTWAYARGERTVVTLNMSERAQPVEATGTIVLSTERTLEGTAVEGPQIYRLADIPRSISWAEVGQVLACVERRTPASLTIPPHAARASPRSGPAAPYPG